MAVFGFSINTLTLMGLVLAIGLVVDDAIIVVENVEKYLERGYSPLEATRAAMAEITTPIVTITLVLAAVFVPVAFIPGLTGRLYNQFAFTIVFSFVFSAINSLTFSPAMARLFLKATPSHGESRFFLFRWFNRGMRWLENSYDSFLEYTAHHWWTIVVPSLGLLALTGFMLVERPKAFIPVEDQGYIIVTVQTPDGTTRSRRERIMARVEQIALEMDGVRDTVRFDGLNPITQVNQPNTGAIYVMLEAVGGAPRPSSRANALASKLQRGLSAEVREALVLVFPPPPIQGLGTTGGFEFMLEDRAGRGVEALADVTDRFLAAARKRPELTGLYTPFSARVPQLRFDLDRTKARTLDVPVSSVFESSRSISAAITSTTSTSSARPGGSMSRPRAPTAPPDDILRCRSSTAAASRSPSPPSATSSTPSARSTCRTTTSTPPPRSPASPPPATARARPSQAMRGGRRRTFPKASATSGPARPTRS